MLVIRQRQTDVLDSSASEELHYETTSKDTGIIENKPKQPAYASVRLTRFPRITGNTFLYLRFPLSSCPRFVLCSIQLASFTQLEGCFYQFAIYPGPASSLACSSVNN